MLIVQKISHKKFRMKSNYKFTIFSGEHFFNTLRRHHMAHQNFIIFPQLSKLFSTLAIFLSSKKSAILECNLIIFSWLRPVKLIIFIKCCIATTAPANWFEITGLHVATKRAR